ncbi:hypothetical protein [Helicobacter sp. 13S00477-4]|nr:hypothetical protein [Helicobacter sp. 13S00477-4]
MDQISHQLNKEEVIELFKYGIPMESESEAYEKIKAELECIEEGEK